RFDDLKRWVDDEAEARALQTFHLRRYDGAIELEGELRQGRRGHGWATEERYRDPIVHFLIDEHGEMAALLERRDCAPRALTPFAQQLSCDLAPRPAYKPVDKRIVGGTVDARERQTALRRSNRQDLPIPDMRGEEDSRLAVVAQAIEMFCVDHFDAVAGRTKPYITEMRIFTEDAAEVLPHIRQYFTDFGRRFFGEGVAEVVRRMTRYRQKSPECSAYPAAACGRPIERQQTKDAESDKHAGCLEPAHDNAESREKGRARLSHGSRGIGPQLREPPRDNQRATPRLG